MFKYALLKKVQENCYPHERGRERENKLTMSHSALLTSLRFLACLVFQQSLL